jgi:2,5-furandicarboxylate decarboxylase 1
VPIASFRELLGWLEERGELARVGRAVDPAHELVAVLRKTQQGPDVALLFENVKGSPLPVASNVMSRRSTIAAALGMTAKELLPALAAREAQTIEPQRVPSAPVQELRLDAGRFDVARDVPQVIHAERDAGAYVSAGIFLARHPQTGVYNASWNRAQLVGTDRMRVRMMPPQHLGQYQAIAEARDEALPAAIIIGAPPALMLAAASKIPIEADELGIAGAWQGAPLRVVPAKSVPLLVPADAEMVIEGEVLPKVREEEGPFGEFMDAYVEAGPNHVFRASAITRRRDAIYHVILAGGSEDLALLGLMLQVEVWRAVTPHARVCDVGCPGQILGCVVAIEKTRDEEAGAVLRAALAAHRWLKFVVVVDADVNPHDAGEVMWAIHTRLNPERGVLRVEGAPGFSRPDVAALHVGKLGLDATYPVAMKANFARRRFPGIEKVDLAAYLGTSFGRY